MRPHHYQVSRQSLPTLQQGLSWAAGRACWNHFGFRMVILKLLEKSNVIEKNCIMTAQVWAKGPSRSDPCGSCGTSYHVQGIVNCCEMKVSLLAISYSSMAGSVTQSFTDAILTWWGNTWTGLVRSKVSLQGFLSSLTQRQRKLEVLQKCKIFYGFR